MFRAALPSDSVSMALCSLVREQTRSVMTEEPSSFMMMLSDVRRNAEAMSARDNGRAPTLEPRTVSEVDDENGSGHALVGTADSKHVVPRACWARRQGPREFTPTNVFRALTPPCSAELEQPTDKPGGQITNGNDNRPSMKSTHTQQTDRQTDRQTDTDRHRQTQTQRHVHVYHIHVHVLPHTLRLARIADAT